MVNVSYCGLMSRISQIELCAGFEKILVLVSEVKFPKFLGILFYLEFSHPPIVKILKFLHNIVHMTIIVVGSQVINSAAQPFTSLDLIAIVVLVWIPPQKMDQTSLCALLLEQD